MREDALIAVYIMASRRNGTLYTGVTTDLLRRAYEHREGALAGFTKRYGVTRLVWYEPFELIGAAVQREHTIKGYPRAWKLNLIEAENPEWLDLYERFNLSASRSGCPEQVRARRGRESLGWLVRYILVAGHDPRRTQVPKRFTYRKHVSSRSRAEEWTSVSLS